MRAMIEYKLPDDNAHYQASVMAMDIYDVLWQIDQTLRNKLKHTELSDDAVRMAEEVRDIIAELNLERIV